MVVMVQTRLLGLLLCPSVHTCPGMRLCLCDYEAISVQVQLTSVRQQHLGLCQLAYGSSSSSSSSSNWYNSHMAACWVVLYMPAGT
jgi:hypothetical protein